MSLLKKEIKSYAKFIKSQIVEELVIKHVIRRWDSEEPLDEYCDYMVVINTYGKKD
jgi:hypothetical protein